MSTLIPPIGSGDHVLGAADAKASLVEFGDYECPYCGRAFPIVHTVLRRLGKAVRFAYRHLPLTQLHPHALSAALAAEAAAAQGKFWNMHSMLFQNQEALEDEDLLEYAAALRLDLDRFADDMRRGTGLTKVRNDFRSAARSGARGTPTFFINGYRFDGSWDADTLTAAIRHAMGTAAAIAP